MDFINKFFRLKEKNTNCLIELNAGVATFMTMAYIIVVNPLILSSTGMDKSALTAATCIAAAVASIVMGLLANYPIAQAPGLGLNAYFAYTAVPYIARRLDALGISAEHEPWQIALGAVFLSGAVFLILTVLKVRELIVDSIPESLKHAISSGLGLMLAFLGLQYAKIVVPSQATFVGLGDITSETALISLIGLIVTVVLMHRKVKGAILIGIFLISLLAAYVDNIHFGAVFSTPVLDPVAFKMDFSGLWKIGVLDIIFVFLFIDMFDTIGTLIGVGEQLGLMKNGKLVRVNKALASDAVGTMVGACVGTSTVTSYVESASGVAEGGRTGLTSIVTGVCFLLAMFFVPVVTAIPRYATMPALLIVGSMMTRNMVRIKWDDLTEAIPAFLTLLTIMLSFSISNGIAIGFISYVTLKMFTGKQKEVSVLSYVLAILFIVRFIFLSF